MLVLVGVQPGKDPYINALYSPLIPMPEIGVLAYVDFAKWGVLLWYSQCLL